MSELEFRFTDNQNTNGCLDELLRHAFMAAPGERGCQDDGDTIIAIFDGMEPDIARTAQLDQQEDKLLAFRRRLREHGDRVDELGAFEISVECDETDPTALDVAAQAIALTLAEWAYYTRTLVAFTYHVGERNMAGKPKAPHLHVFWDRRSEEKLYRDSVLQWYLCESLDTQSDTIEGR